MALAMQQLLLSWILIGILDLPADQVGVIRSNRSPRHCSYAHGGCQRGSTDARQLLVRITLLHRFCLFLLLMEQWQWLGVSTMSPYGG